MTKKLKRTLLIGAVVTVLVAIVLAGAVSRLTDGFNTLDPEEIFAKDLNEKNLLFGTYDDLETVNDVRGITIENDKGTIVINGEMDVDDTKMDYVLASVELDAGTYTYSCFNRPNLKKIYSYATYTDAAGTDHIVYGDFKNLSGLSTSAVVEDMTFTLSEKTTLTFVISIQPGAEVSNVKAMPCLVPGDEVGSFYAD